MNKTVLCLLTFLCSITFYAQEKKDVSIDTIETINPKHEVKLNAFWLVVGSFDVSYEYLLNEESAFGLEVFLPFDEELKDEIEYYISPYYRIYFGKKYAAGFFLEGFGMLNSSDRDINIFFEEQNEDFVTDFALGIGLGGKWVTNSGFVGEINFGIGRNLFQADKSEYDFVGKFAIALGYRF